MSFEVITEKMVYGGDCIAKIEGKTVFIPYAIPGEKLEIEIVKDLRDYSIGKIIKILEPSPDRTIPFCKYYGQCGGCNMMHISSQAQQKYRKQILEEAFTHEGIEIPDVEVISGNSQGYRSRFQFHNGGLMEKNSNNIIKLDSCPCATEEINYYLKEVPESERPEGRVHVFGTSKITSIPQGYDKIIIAKEEPKENPKHKKMPQRTVNGRKLPKQKKIKAQYAGTTVKQENLCTVSMLDKQLTFDVQGFFQSNIEVLEKTIPHITEGLKGKNVLDMYSGVGTFSIFLADNFDKLTLVEHNKNAVVYAEQNLAGIPHESFGLSGETWVKYHAESYTAQNGNFDAVVIDPPRSGMEKEVCKYLQNSGIPKIRSISCDIATHARDAKFLLKAGYKLEKLFLLDFYPQTCHIESLAWFTKED